jgi:hypothetical protein
MVYVFLTHKGNGKNALSIPFAARWKLLPFKWKQWWESWFLSSNNEMMLDDDSDYALFKDVTEEVKKIERATNDLRWLPLALCMDKHFAVPEVSGTDYAGMLVACLCLQKVKNVSKNTYIL